jgi:TonB family protein
MKPFGKVLQMDTLKAFPAELRAVRLANGGRGARRSNIRQPAIIKLVKPEYPPEAIKAHVEGVVILEATVTERGDVADIKVISGAPMVIPAAIKAVEQWKYERILLFGTN